MSRVQGAIKLYDVNISWENLELWLLQGWNQLEDMH
jgi:hypothetical protein